MQNPNRILLGNIVNGQIFLTLQSPNMISVIDAVLWLHLRITGLAQFVIFCDITTLFKFDFCTRVPSHDFS